MAALWREKVEPSEQDTLPFHTWGPWGQVHTPEGSLGSPLQQSAHIASESGVGREQECGELTWLRGSENARLGQCQELLAARHGQGVPSGMEELVPLACSLAPSFLSLGNEQPSTDLSESRGLCRGVSPVLGCPRVCPADSVDKLIATCSWAMLTLGQSNLTPRSCQVFFDTSSGQGPPSPSPSPPPSSSSHSDDVVLRTFRTCLHFTQHFPDGWIAWTSNT